MFDVAVVGGGLAGGQAAAALALRQKRVLLLEARHYPHDKVCGEFLSPECAALFAESGFLPVLQELNPVRIDTLRITVPNGGAWRTRFPAPALGISRAALDAALAGYVAQQGVDVRQGMQVTNISGGFPGGFTLTARSSHGTQTFHAAAVISAHGKRSSLDRRLNRAFLRQPQPYLALKRHFQGPPLPHHIDLHGFPGGYCGMSEIEGGQVNVCLLVRQDVFQRAGNGRARPVDAFVNWLCMQNVHLGRWLAQSTPVDPDWLSIAQVALGPKSPVEGDLLLAGDAAGMVAPLAGDGMAMALHSGSLAARLLDRYLTGALSASELKAAYSRTWKATFRSRLRLGQVLQTIMLRPALLTPGVGLLNRLPALGDYLVAQTRDLALLGGTKDG